MRNDKENMVVRKSTDFAVSVIALCGSARKQGWIPFSNQLFKCGTSIGANVREAQNAESLSDFIHKMKLAAKEVDETMYWFEIGQRAQLIEVSREMKQQLMDLMKLISKIVSSSKKRLRLQKKGRT